MAKSLNTCSFSGYLAADPKTHTFDDGNSVANLRLAVNNTKKVDGQYVDDAIFIDVKSYGGQVDAIGTYLSKGSFVIVTGQLAQPREWEDGNGAKRFTMVIDRATVVFGPKSDGQQAQQTQQQTQPRQQQQPASPAASDDFGIDDFGDDSGIPF
jgi:single-strand DNA-binding protein